MYFSHDMLHLVLVGGQEGLLLSLHLGLVDLIEVVQVLVQVLEHAKYPLVLTIDLVLGFMLLGVVELARVGSVGADWGVLVVLSSC